MPLLPLTLILLVNISGCINCTNPRLCIKSLEQWEQIKHGLKFTETAIGRDYAYCTHTFMNIADIAANATLIAANIWYSTTPLTPCHAAIEMIFELNAKYVIVINEGFSEHLLGSIVCHQIYANNKEAGAKYLRYRSKHYRMLSTINFTENTTKYQDVFDGPVKQINDLYVRNKWVPAKMVNGRLKLNNGCFWYALSLFARLMKISVQRLLTNPNISMPIIRQKNIEWPKDYT